MTLLARLSPYLLAMPFALIFIAFFIIPLVMVVVVSFWDYTEYSIIPDFIFTNYEEMFAGCLTKLPALCTTFATYLSTLKFVVLTWLLCLVIGFIVAYFLAFCVSSLKMQIVLFLVCTIPFWTSNVIRMISWIPLLGRNGLVNQGLMGAGLTDAPIEWLLYSSFSVTVAFVHLYALFMVVPIFNSMMRIDRSLIEAAYDTGASGWQTLWNVIIPLCKPGIVIGSIFVITIVMGDFLTVGVMGGQQIASIGKIIQVEMSYLQFPAAAANAVILLIVTLLIIVGMTRIIDIRRELQIMASPLTRILLGIFFALFVLFLYGPMISVFVLAFQGPEGGLTFPMRGFSTFWFEKLWEGVGVVDIWRAFRRSLALGAVVMVITVVLGLMAGLAFRRRFYGSGALFYITVASLIVPSIVVSLGIALEFRLLDDAVKDWGRENGVEWIIRGYTTSMGLFTSAMGAQLTWTLPFGLLIMFAVFNRFNPAYEEAARDLGAGPWRTFREAVLPLIAPSLIGVALFGFTLSYDEIARTSQAIGGLNTLPLELRGLTTTVTDPSIYALGAVTTGFSFLVIAVALGTHWWLGKRRQARIAKLDAAK